MYRVCRQSPLSETIGDARWAKLQGFCRFPICLVLERACSKKLNVYDCDGNGKVSFNDILDILRDLTGQFISEHQREHVLAQVLEEAGYRKDSQLVPADFIKILSSSDLKMEVEVPVD